MVMVMVYKCQEMSGVILQSWSWSWSISVKKCLELFSSHGHGHGFWSLVVGMLVVGMLVVGRLSVVFRLSSFVVGRWLSSLHTG